MSRQETKKGLQSRIELGDYRVQQEAKYYQALSYKVTIYPYGVNGIDMIIESEEWVMSAEVTNWNKNGYLNLDRLSNYISNYEEVEKHLTILQDRRDRRRLLIYSYDSNIENIIKYLLEARIELRRIGKQDIPTEKEIKGWIN